MAGKQKTWKRVRGNTKNNNNKNPTKVQISDLHVYKWNWVGYGGYWKQLPRDNSVEESGKNIFF